MARIPEFEIGETLMRAAGMWRRNLLKLGSVILIFSVFGAVVQVLVSVLLQGGFPIPGVTPEPTQTGSLIGAVITVAAALVVAALVSGVNAHVAETEVRGEKSTFIGGWKCAWRNFLSQLGIQLILGILLAVAAFISALFGVLFILPFLIFLVLIIAFLGLAPMIQVIERRGVFASLSASVSAGEGNHMGILGYYIIAYIGAVVALVLAYLVMAVVIGLAVGAAGLSGGLMGSGGLGIGFIVVAVPLYLAFAAAIPLAAGAIPASVYVSLRRHRSEQAVGSIFD